MSTNRDHIAEAEEEMPREVSPIQNFDLEADSSPPPLRPGHYTQRSSSAQPTSPFTSDFDKDNKIVTIIDGKKLRDSSTSISRMALSNSMRSRFRIRDQPEEDRSLWTLLFSVIKLDVVDKGPDNMSYEFKGSKTTFDPDHEWFNLIKSRYETIFERSIDTLSPLGLEAVIHFQDILISSASNGDGTSMPT